MRRTRVPVFIPRRYLTPEKVAAMQADRDTGMTTLQICRKYNVGEKTVQLRTVNPKRK